MPSLISMSPKNTRLLVGLILTLAAGLSPIPAQTSVATVPEGFINFSLPATKVGQNSTTYLSVPLMLDPNYSGSISSVTSNSITVADNPAPWTSGGLAAASSPYFVKFLTGAEKGRIIRVTANTTNTLTLDTTDNSNSPIQTVALTAPGFSVQPGDTFQVFPGDTLASLFGANTAQSPLILNGTASPLTSDSIGIYSAAAIGWQTFYFDTSSNYWKLLGSSQNVNNTVLYPGTSLIITRRANEPALTFTLTGRTAEVPLLTKTTGNSGIVYSSTRYATDLKLSQLQFGSNWTQNNSPLIADSIGIWDAIYQKWDSYYQLPDSTWRELGNPSTDQSNLVIPGGSALAILKRGAISVTDSTSFLASPLPYSLN